MGAAEIGLSFSGLVLLEVGFGCAKLGNVQEVKQGRTSPNLVQLGRGGGEITNLRLIF